MREVSISILDTKDIKKDLIRINNSNIDYIHIDEMDGKFVTNKNLPFINLYKYVNLYHNKSLDVHLMVEKPLEAIKKYAKLNTKYICFHVEIEDDIEELLKSIKSYNIKCGLAIKPNTELYVLEPYIPLLDMVLVMSVEPGKGGQKFNNNTIQRVNDLKKMLPDNVIISVDGGINADTVKNLKCDRVVSGTFLLNEEMEERIEQLK